MVSGYQGLPQAYVAMQQGEAQGMCGLVRTHINDGTTHDVLISIVK